MAPVHIQPFQHSLTLMASCLLQLCRGRRASSAQFEQSSPDLQQGALTTLLPWLNKNDPATIFALLMQGNKQDALEVNISAPA